jgi:FkbM family methyltransferase
MIHKTKKLLSSGMDVAHAIVEGNYFANTLENQLTALEALKDLMRRVESLETTFDGLDSRVRLAFSNTMAELSADAAKQNEPEEKIIQFILPFLREKTAIDVGAHRGRFTEALLTMGFEKIYAIEPHPQLAKELKDTYVGDSRVDILAAALGKQDGEGNLHLVAQAATGAIDTDPLLFSALQPHSMPAGIEFTGEKIAVKVRRLENLIAEGILPSTAGLLKVDAEGQDLEVLKGMPGRAHYQILMSEFWSPDFVFATETIPSAEEVRRYLFCSGFPFSLSVVRMEGQHLGFVANMSCNRPNSWGNTLYFSDQKLFEIAYNFTSKLLTQII